MDLSRQEYPALLDSLQPSQAVELLNNRVGQINKVNHEIADWLEERRHIEETYAQSLRKQARKQSPGTSSDLGIFLSPWRKITSAMDAIADSHHALAQKIEADVERPLRQYAGSNREMQSLSTIQGNLASLATDVETAQRKADKGKDRGGSRATSNVEDALGQWNSQAPFVFEQLQAVDETRCNHLRDVLTQYETHEADLVQRNRITVETCLNALLNLNTADEVQTFAARISGGAGQARSIPAARPDRTERTSSRSQSSRDLISPVVPPMRSPAPELRRELSGLPQEDEKTEKKSRGLPMKPFKRLGTVLKGRRQSSMPQTPPAALKNRTDSSISNAQSVRLNDTPPPSSFTREEPTDEPEQYTAPPGPPPNRRAIGRTTSDLNAPLPSPPVANGAGSRFYGQMQEPLQPTLPRSANQPYTNNTDAEGYSVPPPAIDPISQAQLEASESPIEMPGQQYKLDIRNEPIADASQNADTALADMAEQLRLATPSRRTTLRGRRDVRNTIYRESPSAMPGMPDMPAMPNNFSTEQQPVPPMPPIPTASPISMQPSTNSGIIMTPFIASMQGAGGITNGTAQSASDTRSLTDSVNAPSVQSPTMTTTSTSIADKHADVTTPGMTTSIVETVSCWLEYGSVTRAIVTGEVEVALGHNTPSSNYFPRPATENIRLDNFPVLEKVAANPGIVSQIDGKPGEYRVNVASISEQTATAFKYQMHIDSSTLSHQAPIMLTPTWRIEPSQTSVILTYGLNPAYQSLSSSTSSITLTNVVLAISLGTGPETASGRAISCLSKPAGTFSKERGTIYWRLQEVTLSPGMPSEKLLARFTTEGEATPGKVDAKWEISGNVTAQFGSGLGVSVASEGGVAAPSSDPFADEDETAGTEAVRSWTVVEGTRRLVSGTYTAI